MQWVGLQYHRGLTQSQCGVILYESCQWCFMKRVTDSLLWVNDSWQDAMLMPETGWKWLYQTVLESNFVKRHVSNMFYDSLCIYHTVKLSNNSPITIEMLSCNKCYMCIFHSFIEQNMLGNEPLSYIFGIWSLNFSLKIRFSKFQKFSKLMVLYERLQMLYEPKIRVTGSFRKLLHILYERSYRFFMRQMQFRPYIQL